MSYIATIGLEVHVQLKTRSKMFCGCAVEFGAEPNTRTCPTCLGLPGGLPVMNEEALRLTLLTGLMLDCDLAAVSKFDRKNYFYPDMPKNYQISQYDLPLCTNGRVSLHDLAYPKDAQKKIASPNKSVSLVRIHLEEDVARSFHFESATGIDFNRAGTPLMEIVTQPEINSPEEAFAFLSSLRQVLVQGGVSDAEMEKGQMRCDCNVSVRPKEQTEFGTKVEIKNLNSMSAVRRALAFETERQSAALARHESLQQETRGWDDDLGKTYLMRTKESAHDYRYFPDPDLVPVRTEPFLAEVRARLPELPGARRARLIEQYQITDYDAAVLSDNVELARYFEAAAGHSSKSKQIANWILNDLQNALSVAGQTIRDCKIQPGAMAELVDLIDRGRISGKQAKEVFGEMFSTGKEPAEIVTEKGLEQLTDEAALDDLADKVIAANPKPAQDFRSGNAASLNFLTGQVMKLSKGSANPQLVRAILQRKIEGAAAGGSVTESK